MTAGWAFRRQSELDKWQQDAFLADIAAHWQPRTLGQRLLHLRSLGVHLWVRLFGGEPTLAPAAIAGFPTGVGTVLLMLAARPVGQLDPGPPAWDYLILTIGLLGFVAEAARSPRRVRPWRLALFFGVPTAVGSAVNAATLRMVVLSDYLFRVGMAVLALAALVIVAVPLVAAARRAATLRLGMRAAGVSLAATVLGDVQWAMLENSGHHAALMWGCAATALGTGLMAIAFLHAHPQVN